MPVTLRKHADFIDESDDSFMLNPDGTFTIESQVILDFLDLLEWDEVFDNAEDIIEVEDGLFVLDATGEPIEVELEEASLDEMKGRKYPTVKRGGKSYKMKMGGVHEDEAIGFVTYANEDEDGDIPQGESPEPFHMEVESLDGEDVVDMIDEDDLYDMFVHHVAHHMQYESITDKVMLTTALSMMDESDAEEALDILEDRLDEFQKGAFRKMVKSGGGRRLVNRMLGAMIAKQAIKRASAKKSGIPNKEGGFRKQGGSPGTGYKGGDYDRNIPGYAPGTDKGKKVWRRFKKRNFAKMLKNQKKTYSKISKDAIKAGKTKGEVAAAISKAGGKTDKLSVKAIKKGKANIKSPNLGGNFPAPSKKKKGKKGGSSLAASDHAQYDLTESTPLRNVGLAGAVAKSMSKNLNG